MAMLVQAVGLPINRRTTDSVTFTKDTIDHSGLIYFITCQKRVAACPAGRYTKGNLSRVPALHHYWKNLRSIIQNET